MKKNGRVGNWSYKASVILGLKCRFASNFYSVDEIIVFQTRVAGRGYGVLCFINQHRKRNLT